MNDHFGYSVDALGDVDGDGVPDVAVGAYWDDDGGKDHGAVYVLFLNTDSTVKAAQKFSDSEVMRQRCLAPCESPSAIAPSRMSVTVTLPLFVRLPSINR